MKIKFVATPKMRNWVGAGGLWRDGQTQDLPDHVANRLLGLYQSPFVKVGGKSITPDSDKMLKGAPENKAVDIEKPKEPTGDNVGKGFKATAWSKKKAKKKK